MKPRLPGPAFVLATIALFVALSGGAVAAGIVPLAKHAYSADTATNARKLDGKTATQLAATIHGARGPQGATGRAGAVGPAGPAGPQGATGATGATGPQGATGPKGDVGSGLHIVGTVATVGDLPASGTTGDAYLVGGDLQVWTGSAWTDAGPVQGPKGDTGATGPTGATGATGPTGPQGAPGTAAVSEHTQAYSLAASGASGDQQAVTANCAAGQKAVGGGFDSTGDVFNLDSAPTAGDDGWAIYLVNGDNASNTGTVYVLCLG